METFLNQQPFLFYSSKKEGRFTIGPATVISGNQKLETQPIVIEVSKGNSQQSNSQSSQAQQNQGKEKINMPVK